MADKKIRQSKSSVLFFWCARRDSGSAAPGRVPRTPAQRNKSGSLLSVHRAAPGLSPRDRPKNKDRSYDRSLFFGAPGGTRTRDLLIRSQTLYPAELRAHMPSINDSFTIILDWRTKVKAFPQIPALPEKQLPVRFRNGREA